MSKFKTAAMPVALAIIGLAGPLTAASHAENWTSSASYNCNGAGNMNAPSNYSMGDANGRGEYVVMVDEGP